MKTSSAQTPLPTAEIIVIGIDRLEPRADELLGLLNDEEKTRCRRFASPQSGRRFGLFRGALRLRLGRLLNISPSDVRFRSDPRGKPLLDESVHSGVNLHFNLSHSGDWLALATADLPVGIDIEDTRRTLDFVRIAHRVFGERAASILAGMSPDRRRDLFYRWWTAYEAFIKARGAALFADSKQLDPSDYGEAEYARICIRGAGSWYVMARFFAPLCLSLATPEPVQPVFLDPEQLFGTSAAFVSL